MIMKGFSEHNPVESCGNLDAELKVDDVEIEKITFRKVPYNVKPVGIIIGENSTEINSIS